MSLRPCLPWRAVCPARCSFGVLASLQIPLAYLVGKALHSRRDGMCLRSDCSCRTRQRLSGCCHRSHCSRYRWILSSWSCSALLAAAACALSDCVGRLPARIGRQSSLADTRRMAVSWWPLFDIKHAQDPEVASALLSPSLRRTPVIASCAPSQLPTALRVWQEHRRTWRSRFSAATMPESTSSRSRPRARRHGSGACSRRRVARAV